MARDISTTGNSSQGPKSQSFLAIRPVLPVGGANFGSEMFNASQTASSVPKSVEEEPNSGNSVRIDKTDLSSRKLSAHERLAQQNQRSTNAPPSSGKPLPGWGVLRDSDNTSEDHSKSSNQLLPTTVVDVRHQSLTPPQTGQNLH